MDLSILNPPLKRSRINFRLPDQWPKSAFGNSEAEMLDRMSETPIFMDLCIALLSDAFWFSQYKERGIKAFDASIILGKQILHSTYNFDGTFKKDLGFFLNYFVDSCALNPGDERYVSNHELQHYTIQNHLNVWQCIQILIKRAIYKFDLECSARFNSLDIENFHIADCSGGSIAPFIETNAYHLDALGILLRTSMCITNLIQKLHLEFMVLHGREAPAKYSGFKRNSDLGPRGKLKKEQKLLIWNNYLFDIAAMWMVTRRFHEALMDSDSKDFIHASGKARLWSLTSGLAESSKNMILLGLPMQNIFDCAVALHFLYLRLWQHALPAMQNHASELTLKRCMAKLSAQVFVKSDETIKIDKPDCGSATLLDNAFQYTLLSPEYLGLVAKGHEIFGLSGEDINFSFFTGFISTAVTQSTEHLWVSVRHPQSWIGQIDQGLTNTANYDKVKKWLLNQTWCNYDILQDEYKAFRKSHYKNHEKIQNEEIENILKGI